MASVSFLAKFRGWLSSRREAGQPNARAYLDTRQGSPSGAPWGRLSSRLVTAFKRSPRNDESASIVRKMANERFNKVLWEVEDDAAGWDAHTALQSIVQWRPSWDSERVTDFWRKAYAHRVVQAAADWSEDDLPSSGDPFADDEDLVLLSAIRSVTEDMRETLALQQSFRSFLDDASQVNHPLCVRLQATEARDQQLKRVFDPQSRATIVSGWQLEFDRCTEDVMAQAMDRPGGVRWTPAARAQLFDQALALATQRLLSPQVSERR